MLADNKTIQQHVLCAVNAVGKKAGLESHELLEDVVLCDTEWTQQNGMLVLNRRAIYQKYKKQIMVRSPTFPFSPPARPSRTCADLVSLLRPYTPSRPCLARPLSTQVACMLANPPPSPLYASPPRGDVSFLRIPSLLQYLTVLCRALPCNARVAQSRCARFAGIVCAAHRMIEVEAVLDIQLPPSSLPPSPLLLSFSLSSRNRRCYQSWQCGSRPWRRRRPRSRRLTSTQSSRPPLPSPARPSPSGHSSSRLSSTAVRTASPSIYPAGLTLNAPLFLPSPVVVAGTLSSASAHLSPRSSRSLRSQCDVDCTVLGRMDERWARIGAFSLLSLTSK